VGEARACVFAIDDMSAINKAVINVRKMYPDLPLLVKAKNTMHKERLEKMFDNIYVMSPVFQEDSVLLTLPFGGAVLKNLGLSQPEIEAIVEDFRKMHMEDDQNFNDETFTFLNSFKKGISIPVIPTDNKNSDKSMKSSDKNAPEATAFSNWVGTDEEERQEEESEMHEHSRITDILNERNEVEKSKKNKTNGMNGMIGGVEEENMSAGMGDVEPSTVFLDGLEADVQTLDV
jgi:hypothetical protein